MELKKPLQQSDLSLCGPDRTQLKVLGKIPLDFTHKETSCTQTIYVAMGVKSNLLGFPAIKALNLLSHVESIDENVVSKYPSLFSGLGTFVHEYKIQLKPDAQPFVLCTPRNVPLALRPKVQA